jgi:hypothetical protein
MEYQTNIVVDHHNVWTLSKHVAGSLNKFAARTDANVYGTKTNIMVVPIQPVKDNSIGWKDYFFGVGCFMLVVIFIYAFFTAYNKGDVKGKYLPWF